MNNFIVNDEPSKRDCLGRQALARAFADLALNCQTPFVFGIFGAWGSGKSTFLRLIESELDSQTSRVVWFNAWEHDLDDAPAVSLLHTTVESLGLNQEFRHAIAKVALAFGSVLLRKTTTLTINDLGQVQDLLDKENFRIREARSKLKKHFQKILNSASSGPNGRVIFFVDDLDRCSPENVLRTLSAIKLYFNVPGCVFFLAVDRETIESALANSNQVVSKSGEGRYLDKMIQLPFFLPPIAEETFESFVASLLPKELSGCLAIISSSLERNPRTLKRFVNNLLLRHGLAVRLKIENYDVRLLALLLLIEHEQPDFFKKLVTNPQLLRKLQDDSNLLSKEISSHRLRHTLSISYIPRYAPIEMYLSLTHLNLTFTPKHVEWQPAIAAHRLWLKSYRQKGVRANLHGVNLSGAELFGALLREVDFSAAVLSEADLRNSDLRRANFTGASLKGAKLKSAILRYADFSETNLESADLSYADLNNAVLTRANLQGADLRHTIGLNQAQITESLVNDQTMLPMQHIISFKQTTKPSDS